MLSTSLFYLFSAMILFSGVIILQSSKLVNILVASSIAILGIVGIMGYFTSMLILTSYLSISLVITILSIYFLSLTKDCFKIDQLYSSTYIVLPFIMVLMGVILSGLDQSNLNTKITALYNNDIVDKVGHLLLTHFVLPLQILSIFIVFTTGTILTIFTIKKYR